MICKSCERDEFVVAWSDPTVVRIRCISCGQLTLIEKQMSHIQFKQSIPVEEINHEQD